MMARLSEISKGISCKEGAGGQIDIVYYTGVDSLHAVMIVRVGAGSNLFLWDNYNDVCTSLSMVYIVHASLKMIHVHHELSINENPCKRELSINNPCTHELSLIINNTMQFCEIMLPT